MGETTIPAVAVGNVHIERVNVAVPEKKMSGYFQYQDKTTTPFFFAHFPDSLNNSDLRKLFERFGRVGDVFVPRKRDKRGRRFGFVKFKEVENETELGRRLEKVRWGDVKLKVNRVRFGREDKGVDERKQSGIGGDLEVTVEGGKKSVAGEGRWNEAHLKQGVSYSNMVMGDRRQKRSLVLHPTEDRVEQLRGCFVGELNKFGDTKLVQGELCMEGLEKIKAIPMGGNLVLLHSDVAGEISRASVNHIAWWEAQFKSVKEWRLNMVARQRTVWLKIFGIPLCVWEEETFKGLGSLFGVFLDFDEATISRRRFDWARIKVVPMRNSRFLNQEFESGIRWSMVD